jgi:signal transduction histidine kinase
MQDELKQADVSALAEQTAADALIEEKLEAEYKEREKTLALTPEEMEKAFMASGVTPTEDITEAVNTAKQAAAADSMQEAPAPAPVPAESADEGMVNFVQLNKDIRKHYRPAMKQRGITTSIKAPEKPVIIDIDRNSLELIVDNIFNQIERLSADGVRNYIEIYRQADKVVYIVRINTSEETRDAAAAAGNDGSFDAASKIVTANDGRFITSMDGNVLKIGVLIEAAD